MKSRARLGSMTKRERTFGRLVLPLVRSVLCADLVEAVEERGATWPAMPTAGEMERTGILGGGPGSAPGDRR